MSDWLDQVDGGSGKTKWSFSQKHFAYTRWGVRSFLSQLKI